MHKLGNIVSHVFFSFFVSRYKWKMNDEDFDAAGNDRRVTIQPGSGTLVFNQPYPRDEAIYQCLAKNQFGTSVSHKINLRRAGKKTYTSILDVSVL